MKKESKPKPKRVKVDPAKIFTALGLNLDAVASKITQSSIDLIVNELYGFLQKASQLEHLLSMQYLFSAFSMKKFPEEFDDYPNADPAINAKRLAQLENIRRWEAEILFVSRQEMEHLNLVQNMIVILGKQPYLYRPNFPIPADQNILGLPINLMPFSEAAMEVFRYWEKPDSVVLPDPLQGKEVPKGIQNFGKAGPHPTEAKRHDEDTVRKAAFARIVSLVDGNIDNEADFSTIEELYDYIWIYFAVLFELRLIDGQNLMKVSEEHFGFNITLDTIVDGKFFDYVDQVIAQIIEEGEGVSIEDPNLIDICSEGDLMGSHFCVYSNLIKEIKAEKANAGNIPFTPALPVVWNPTISGIQEHHSASLPKGKHDENIDALTPVTNEVAIAAMQLFNMGYGVLVRMLNGYFTDYSKDYTTGIRAPQTNAFFRTSFYPFMTMVIRPLGELLCRLPADSSYVPVEGQVPVRTAGPSFFFDLPQQKNLAAELAITAVYEKPQEFIDIFKTMADSAASIADKCTAKNYHVANYKSKDARDFDARFNYLSQNLKRIAQNFEAYWGGDMIAPIPSKGFQNFNNSYN